MKSMAGLFSCLFLPAVLAAPQDSFTDPRNQQISKLMEW